MATIHCIRNQLGMAFWLFHFWFFFVLVFSCHSNSESHSYATARRPANSVSPLQHPSGSNSAMCPRHERSALLQFKESFLIDCDASNDPSGLPKMKSWGHEPKYGNCCMWDGVVCDGESGHVVRLDLGSSCLYGTLPSNSTLFSLTHLQHLDLSANNFNNSTIPSEIGQLSNLTRLILSDSAVSGPIPSEISRLSKLRYLDLTYNDGPYIGLTFEYSSLNMFLRNATRLRQLYLDGVDISSRIPVILANLTSLKYFSFRSCNFYGEFPTTIFHLPLLEGLDFRNNVNLVGTLPEFQLNTSIRYLILSNTAFHGELPSWIGKLVHLERLELGLCHFSGKVPASIGHLTNLFTLDLGYSGFSGKLPSSFTNLTNLQQLSLSNLNVRSENLISWLSKLNKLVYLSISGMNFGGQIPSFFANFTSLKHLDLSGNQLTGKIPNGLMNLTQLEWLSLQNNHLNGPIPSEWISQLTSLTTLYLNFNDNLYGKLNPFFKLPNLVYLDLSSVHLTSLANNVTNESVPQLIVLFLDSCNLTEFPQFLHSQDELQSLVLSNNNIKGLIPQWFVNLTKENLYMLDLSMNFLTAFEDPIKALPWSHMEVLNLNGNQLQGFLPIPPSSVVFYKVSNNELAGDIPHQVCHLKSMQYFDVSFNNLSGQIPSCLSELAGSLEVLNLKSNNFSGSLFHGNYESCKLKMIDVGINQLEGKLPRSWAHCNNLEVLDVGQNQINDTFPSWLGHLPNLNILILRQNNFHGEIGNPKASLEFASLRIIDLSKNFHTGPLPSEYIQDWEAMKVTSESNSTVSGIIFPIDIFTPTGMIRIAEQYNYSIKIRNKGDDMIYSKVLIVLRVIDFSSNNFTGQIPDAIGELRGLQALNLSNNNLKGGIPLSLAKMIDLESLDLSNNMLSGEIPQELTQLTALEVFNVSHNLLVGAIPQGRQFGAFDNSSFADNLGLCGIPLSKICRTVIEPSEPSATGTSYDEQEEESDSRLIQWIIRVLGYASGFAVGCALGKYFTDCRHEWFVETFGRRKSK